jgi:hypothetical protein
MGLVLGGLLIVIKVRFTEISFIHLHANKIVVMVICTGTLRL